MLLQTISRLPGRFRRLWMLPQAAMALRCAGALVMGALLAGAGVTELPVPLALAWLSAQTFGAEAVCAYLGTAAGLLLRWPLNDALEPLAAGFLMLAGLGLFRGLLPQERRWFLPAASAALYAVVGLVFLLQGPLQPFEAAFFCLRLALLAAGCAAFCGNFAPQALVLAAIAGGCRWMLPAGLPLGALLAACAVCCTLDSPYFLQSAVLCALVLDLCWQPPLSATLVFSAAALVAHAIPFQSRLGRGLLFSCICSVCILLAGGLAPRLILTTLGGALCAAAIPETLLARIFPLLGWQGETDAAFGPAAELLTELAADLARSAPVGAQRTSAAETQRRARRAEAREILAEQYRILSRLLTAGMQTQRSEPARFVPEVETVSHACGEISGDRTLSFRCGEWFYALLCDGMGTGPEAAEAAGQAASLLRHLIEAGFDAQDAMQMLNALYILRGDGVFSTVDLAQVSLCTGEGYLHKWGAAPSYLRQARGVQKIGTASPPPGLGVGETHEAWCAKLSLRQKQTLVLVSDGVGETDVLDGLHTDAPLRILAAGIVNRGQPEEADDRSAVLLRLRPIRPQHKHSTRAVHFLSKLR